MYGYGKSDDPIVPKKQPNKGERSLAEVVEERGSPKRKSVEQTGSRTQRRTSPAKCSTGYV